MDWLADVESRIKRKNQILFAQNDAFLADLTALMSEQNHRTMVLWALELADEAVMLLRQRYPEEGQPAPCSGKCKPIDGRTKEAKK